MRVLFPLARYSLPWGRRRACHFPLAPKRIEPGHHVADVLDWFPATEPVFMQYGFTLLKQPLLRRTLARGVTRAHAASFRGVPAQEFLDSLNRAIGIEAHCAPKRGDCPGSHSLTRRR